MRVGVGASRKKEDKQLGFSEIVVLRGPKKGGIDGTGTQVIKEEQELIKANGLNNIDGPKNTDGPNNEDGLKIN